MILTRSEQRLEQLKRIKRPLTDAESLELDRCLHAAYMRAWRADRQQRLGPLASHAVENAELLGGVEAEAIANRPNRAQKKGGDPGEQDRRPH